MHFYRFNIGNYNRRTSKLSNDEDLCYRRMLDIYYLDETPLPNDIPKIARLVGFRESPEIIQDVLTDFFILKDDLWHNESADNQISTYQALEKRNQDNGKKGGRPKKETQNKPSGLPVGTQTEPKQKANQEPLTINQEQVTKREVIPYQQIADLYNTNFAIPSSNPEVAKLNNERKRLIKILWLACIDSDDETKLTNNLEYWARYFDHCSGIKFLRGDTERSESHKNWRPDLNYMMKEKTYIQVLEGTL